MRIQLIRTDSENSDFKELVRNLDADLAQRDGTEHSFYTPFNKIDKIRFALVAYQHERAAGCGAIKVFDSTTMEVKRMYVTPHCRGKGIAEDILAELEKWAAELSYTRCVLETGKRQPEAIRLYTRTGYLPIPNYGQYAGVENRLCFEKQLVTREIRIH